MSVQWTLECNGQTHELHQWGLGSVVLRRVNLAVDTLTAVRVAQRFDDPPICDYGDTVRLYRVAVGGDPVKVFEGTRALVPGEASSGSEAQNYLFEGPWAFLARNVFRQTWTGGIGGVLQTIYTSHILLIGSVAHQIRRVLEYARDQLGAPLQIGNIVAPIVPPISEITDRTCAAVIADAIQYAPDSVGWWDYTTSPPTFHLQPRSALQAVTVKTPDIRTGADVRMEGLRVVPRPDIQVPSVEITFETESTIDGERLFGFGRQRFPLNSTGFEDGCLAITVNLLGFSATTVNATLETETIDPNSVEGWKRLAPKLRDEDINSLEIVPGSVIRTDDETGLPAVGLPRRLLSGTAAEWQTNPDGSPVAWQREVISARFNYLKYDDVAGEPRQVKDEYIAVTIVTTNAPEGETDYEEFADFEEGEPEPAGLAEYLYNSLNPLHYDVSVMLIEEEPTGIVTVGTVLNISGSDAGLAVMRALVQEISINIDTGRTSIVAGPPKQLSLTDLMQLLRANRIRRRWTNTATQDSGELGGREVNLGKGTADTNATHGDGGIERLLVRAARTGGSGIDKILFDTVAKHITVDLGSGATMTLQGWTKHLSVIEVPVCVNGDNNWRRLVIGSALYRPGT